MAYIGRDIDKISNVEVLDNITFDGSSSYTLQKGGSNFTPSSANTLLVSIDGVVQAGNFTVSGSTINFGTAVSASSTCNFILHYGVGLITAPADGTVTTAKLADSSVTTAKLNDASVSLAKLTATGTKDTTTFLRGDNTFATPSGAANTPSFLVYPSSGQSLPNNTWNLISFNAENYDTDNCFDTSTKRFTPTTAGKYFLSVAINCYRTTSTWDRGIVNIRKNGSDGGKGFVSIADIKQSSNQTFAVSTILSFNGTTDYADVAFYCYDTDIYLSSGITESYFLGYKIIE